MEQRLSIVTLGVSDLARSREFYERLGWRRSMSNSDGIVFFQAGGMALALYPRQELAKDANVDASGDGFRGFSLAFNARNHEEVDAVLTEERGRENSKASARGFLGRLLRILRRPRRIFVGGRLESVFPDRSKRSHSDS
jgi:catechol 2,3-dioxygenase-like lactoylglutathione lyase family enzyme